MSENKRKIVKMEEAIDFVHKNGSTIEKARLKSILKEKVAEDVVKEIAVLQNEDGGFPYGMQKGNLSTLGDTQVVLTWLRDLNLLDSSSGRKGFEYIVSLQKEDGSWDENPQIRLYDPPPWMIPGDRKTVVYTSAYSAFWLGIGVYTIPFEKACTYLKKCQERSGKFEGFIHSTWIGVSALALKQGWESENVIKGLEFLDSVPLHEWVSSQMSWMLSCFSMAGIPKDNAFSRRIAEELMLRQREDGSFASEDGDPFAVNATVEAIKVIKWAESAGISRKIF